MLAASFLPILIAVLVVLMVLLFIGGYIASGRRSQALAKRLHEEIAAADEALAAARADDRGWERGSIEAAARNAFAARHAGREIAEMHLVQVVDRPGTDADEAVFRVRAADGAEETVRLGRREGAWVPADAGGAT